MFLSLTLNQTHLIKTYEFIKGGIINRLWHSEHSCVLVMIKIICEIMFTLFYLQFFDHLHGVDMRCWIHNFDYLLSWFSTFLGHWWCHISNMELKYIIFLNGWHIILLSMCLNDKQYYFSFTKVFTGTDIKKSTLVLMEVN